MQVYFEVKTAFEDLGSISLAKIKRGPVVLIKKGARHVLFKEGSLCEQQEAVMSSLQRCDSFSVGSFRGDEGN